MKTEKQIEQLSYERYRYDENMTPNSTLIRLGERTGFVAGYIEGQNEVAGEAESYRAALEDLVNTVQEYFTQYHLSQVIAERSYIEGGDDTEAWAADERLKLACEDVRESVDNAIEILSNPNYPVTPESDDSDESSDESQEDSSESE